MILDLDMSLNICKYWCLNTHFVPSNIDLIADVCTDILQINRAF